MTDATAPHFHPRQVLSSQAGNTILKDNTYIVVQEISIQQQHPDTKLADFAQHVSDCNIDFKENVLKKVEMLKLKDTADLQKRVDDLKRDEYLEAERLNKDYLRLEQSEQELLQKTKAKKSLLLAIVAQWETNKRRRALFSAWKGRTLQKQGEHHQLDYCGAFHLQGLKQRGFKAFKLYA
jgi:hypothetical protein